jgi:hypothetical protein
MEEVPSSEDKPSPSQPMDGADYDTNSDDYSDNDEDSSIANLFSLISLTWSSSCSDAIKGFSWILSY